MASRAVVRHFRFIFFFFLTFSVFLVCIEQFATAFFTTKYLAYDAKTVDHKKNTVQNIKSGSPEY